MPPRGALETEALPPQQHSSLSPSTFSLGRPLPWGTSLGSEARSQRPSQGWAGSQVAPHPSFWHSFTVACLAPSASHQKRCEVLEDVGQCEEDGGLALQPPLGAFLLHQPPFLQAERVQ